MAKKVIVLIEPGFEEAEVLIPADLMRRAGIEVTIASTTEKTKVVGMCGISITADACLQEVKHKEFDGLVIPGGVTIDSMADNKEVSDFINRHNDSNRLILAICGGPIVLHHAGILKKQRYTAYRATKHILTGIKDQRVIEDGNLITAQDIVAAFYASLKVIDRLLGKSKAIAVCHNYDALKEFTEPYTEEIFLTDLNHLAEKTC